MKVIVYKEGEVNIRLRFPTGLVLNRFTALFIPAAAKKHGVKLTYRQTVSFIKAIKRCKRAHEDWTLVEVQSAKGEQVFIKL